MVKYFYIMQHDLYTDSPRIINWYNVINPEDINRDRAKFIPKRTLLSVSPNPNMTFYGIISKPFFLVNEMIRDVIKMYDNTVLFKQIVLLDSVNGQAELYFLPILESLECYEEDSKKMLTMDKISDVRIQGDKILNKPIFCIRGNSTHVAVRIDLVESILKRDSRGIALMPVKTA